MSMADKKQLQEEVEKTLQSFDNDIVLEENPFLATRIQGERGRLRQKPSKSLRLRIGLNQALMLGILLINVITVVHYLDWKRNQNLHEKLVLTLKEEFQVVQVQDPF
jgi:hypothetical protein